MLVAQASRLCSFIRELSLAQPRRRGHPGAEMNITLEPIVDFQQIQIDRASSPTLDPETQRRIDHAWAGLCAQNPRYFNSPMLSFESASAKNASIVASVRPYMHHAVRDSIDLGISLLAVTAVLFVEDRVLVGKRSAHSHRYAGLWELGPSGGIDVPGDRDQLDHQAVLQEAIREVHEEAGFIPKLLRDDIVAMIHDHEVGSTDLVVVMEIESPESLSINWEYTDTRWLTLDGLNAWCDERPGELIPTSVALARYLRETRA